MTHPEQPAESSAEHLRAMSLEFLDFPTIREQVADHTVFPPARALALAMTPVYRAAQVEKLQRETAEGLVFLEEASDINLHTSGDATSEVERAALEGTLSGLELLAVAELLEVQWRARSALLRVRDRVPMLANLAEAIHDLNEVHLRIRGCIGSRGEVLDDATPFLGDLRRQVREAYQRVTEALERIIYSSIGQEVFQDQVISMRGDRLVVQVKTEMRQRVPGIVHDASNTGATLFIEPFATVDLCNAWRELALEEERETARVLRELSALVGAREADIKHGVRLTAGLDFILARARYSATVRGVTAQARPSPNDRTADDRRVGVRLLSATHPLLGKEAVPITVSPSSDYSVLVITGPNTGGKTVAMKTVGLIALMHQSGMRIPAADGSALPVFDGIYADVGDQQSIQQSVSTFGSHMRNVIDILFYATPESLVLLDELGTSTDPEEGAALAKAILGHLASKGVTTFATTHHRTVAAHAEATTGMMNASVELDPVTLKPTYHLTLGVPGRSYAMSVAAQLGLSNEIMEEARSLLEPQYLRFEDWLNELQNERHLLKQRLQEAEDAQSSADATRRDLQAQIKDLELRREEILDGMRTELEQRFEETKKKLRRAEAALSWGASVGEVNEARAEMTGAESEVKALKRRSRQEVDEVEQPSPLAVGDLVDVPGLNLRGRVVYLPEQGGEAEVAIGDLRVRLDVHRLSRAQEEYEEVPEGPKVRYELAPGFSGLELKIRGWRADDAMIKVEEYLDRALRDGLSSVRIIHGKGTGALRRAVRELLEHHPLVRSFAPEAPDKGGDGVTVVELM